jgi:hypothetical protein
MSQYKQLHQVLGALRNAAERDSNDIIANACSRLSVDIEYDNRDWKDQVKTFSELQRRIIAYALKNHQNNARPLADNRVGVYARRQKVST